MTTQLISPNPNIPCKPGWCLAYVNEAFGVPKKYGSATTAWFGSQTKHQDRNFPAGVAVPVWYGLDTTPLGHVVLRMPDGTVYSTSDLTNTPYHHPNLEHLEWFYAYYGMNLTYRGWTEDVEDTPVISLGGISYQGDTITPVKDTFMPDLTEDEQRRILAWADRGNAVTPDERAQILTTKHVADIVKQMWNVELPLAGGGTTTPGRKVTYQKQEFNVIGAKIDALAAAVATMVSAQPGVTISSEEILGQIDTTLRDVLAKGSEKEN